MGPHSPRCPSSSCRRPYPVTPPALCSNSARPVSTTILLVSPPTCCRPACDPPVSGSSTRSLGPLDSISLRPTGSSPTPNSSVELGLLAPCPLCRPSPRSCGTARRLVVRARYDAPLPDSRRAFRVLPFPCLPAPRTPAFRAGCRDSGCYPPVGAPSLRAQWREGRGCHASSHGGSSSSSPPSASVEGVGADQGAVLVATGDSLMFIVL